MAQYKNLSATAQVKVGAGKLKGIFVNSSSGGKLSIYNEDQGGTTNKIAVITTATLATAGASLLVTTDGIWFDKGLYILVETAAVDFTVVYE